MIKKNCFIRRDLSWSGFTLIETLVVVAIFSMLFSAIFTMLSVSNNSFNTGSTQQDVENQARQGLNNMIRELYETNAGNVSITGGGNDIITFQLLFDDGSGNLIWGADGIQDFKIRYAINANQLLRQILDASNNLVSQRVLAVDAFSLQFSLSGSMLNISLTSQKSAVGGRVLSHTLSSKVTFRN